MTAPDAETYLRCRLEDTLTGDRGGLLNRVRAAVAIGMITEDAAEVVLADAARVSALRGRELDGRNDEGHDEDDTVIRTVVCPTVIEQDWGSITVTYLVFDEDETIVNVSGRLNAPRPAAAGAHRHRHFPQDQPWQEIEITDESGTVHHAHFSGGSSDDSFDGQYQVHPPLDAASTAVTVAGRRIELTDRPSAATVRVVALAGTPVAELARRHLRLTDTERPRPWHNDDAHDIAVGTFRDLRLDEIEETDDEPPSPPARVRRPRSTRQDSVTRWLAVDVALPRVDGLVLSLGALSDDGRLTMAMALRGRIAGSLHESAVPVSARDDLGNAYTSTMDGGGGSDRAYRMTQQFAPPLAADARMLTIVVDTLCHRIEVDVPLDWQDTR